GTTTFSVGSSAPGGSANAGTTVTVTITLLSSPPSPPANAPITSVTLVNVASGTIITGSNNSDSTPGQVVSTFAIPSNAATGTDNVVVVFTSGPTYTLAGGFTINP
ncbi:MAG: hypothetical protein ABSE48_06385, partial [Verrucomicrobiota bacterium]